MSHARNLRTWLARATESDRVQGAAWYRTAHQQCAQLAHETGCPFDTTCAIVAVLSPALRWERNIGAARDAIAGRRTQAYGANQVKAARLLAGDAPSDVVQGPKVRAFYALLLDPTNEHELCLDSIAVLAALGRNPRKVTNEAAKPYLGRPRVMRAVARAYRQVAAEVGMLPHVLQATVWLAWRNERDRV